VRRTGFDGDGSQPDIVSEINAGHAAGFGTLASLAPRTQHLRVLPFDPPHIRPNIRFMARSAFTDRRRLRGTSRRTAVTSAGQEPRDRSDHALSDLAARSLDPGCS
jgi:hypothetical protein